MKKILILSFSAIFCISSYASEEPLVDVNEIKKWGYKTKALPSSYNYHIVNNLKGEISIKYQLIRSIKPIKGKNDTYHYFTISEECFPNKLNAINRKLALSIDEKDYRLGWIIGNCVCVVNTGAKRDTFDEQPRIFKLFNEYMDRKSHNKSSKPTPKIGAV